MLVSELPASATPVSPGVWTDPSTKSRYVTDPSDATLLLTRDWTAKELGDWNQTLALQSTNQGSLTTALSTSLAALVTDIGVALTDPTLVKDSSSLNGIIKSTPASINADLPGYITALAKYVKRCDKAMIAAGKIATSSFTDASTGK